MASGFTCFPPKTVKNTGALKPTWRIVARKGQRESRQRHCVARAPSRSACPATAAAGTASQCARQLAYTLVPSPPAGEPCPFRA